MNNLDKEMLEYLKIKNPDDVEKFNLITELKTDFYKFVKYFWQDVASNEFVDNWHIEYVCDEVESLSEDLKINLPVGESTTTLLSIMLPAFNLARGKNTLVTTENSPSFVKMFSSKIINLVTSYRFISLFDGIECGASKSSINHSNGSYIKVSTMFSAHTGSHFDYIVCDNVFKNSGEVDFETVINCFDTLYSRKRTRESVVIVAESGYNLTSEIDFIDKHICLPSICNKQIKPKCMKHAYRDGLMNETRHSKDFLSCLDEEMLRKCFTFEKEK